jgi:hypothetical protein
LSKKQKEKRIKKILAITNQLQQLTSDLAMDSILIPILEVKSMYEKREQIGKSIFDFLELFVEKEKQVKHFDPSDMEGMPEETVTMDDMPDLK